MPYKDPQKTKDYYKKYYQDHKKVLQAYGRAYGKRKRREAKENQNGTNEDTA